LNLQPTVLETATLPIELHPYEKYQAKPHGFFSPCPQNGMHFVGSFFPLTLLLPKQHSVAAGFPDCCFVRNRSDYSKFVSYTPLIFSFFFISIQLAAADVLK
jgi:hypothetical protein